MTVKLLTKHHLEFLSLKRGCKGSSESTLVKMPHCWKSNVVAEMVKYILIEEIKQKVFKSVVADTYSSIYQGSSWSLTGDSHFSLGPI